MNPIRWTGFFKVFENHPGERKEMIPESLTRFFTGSPH